MKPPVALSCFKNLLVFEICFWAFFSSSNAQSSLVDNLSSFLNPSVLSKNVKDSSKQGGTLESFRQLGLASTQSFIQRRIFNTSVALTVPLFSFTLPQRASQGSSVDLANQAIFGLFALLVAILVFTVPVLFTGVRPIGITGRSDAGGTQGILNHLMSSTPVFNLMGADLQHKIGLDSTKCLQKTICESHRSPKNKHYGLLALPFQIFFPPPAKGASESRSSPFQLAAKEGKYSKTECGKQFRCFFDFLDLFSYLVDWYKFRMDQEDENDSTKYF